LTIPEFLNQEEIFYKVTLPKSPHFDLATLYPWMLQAGTGSGQISWEVSFARSGVPLKIGQSEKCVTQLELGYVKKSAGDYSYCTRDIISGHGASAHLTQYGIQLMRLLIWPQ